MPSQNKIDCFLFFYSIPNLVFERSFEVDNSQRFCVLAWLCPIRWLFLRANHMAISIRMAQPRQWKNKTSCFLECQPMLKPNIGTLKFKTFLLANLSVLSQSSKWREGRNKSNANPACPVHNLGQIYSKSNFQA